MIHGKSSKYQHEQDDFEGLYTSVKEKAMAPHSSTLALKIPWMGEPGGLPSMELCRVGHDRSDLAAAADFSGGSNSRYGENSKN